jgi:hypothetical protein
MISEPPVDEFNNDIEYDNYSVPSFVSMDSVKYRQFKKKLDMNMIKNKGYYEKNVYNPHKRKNVRISYYDSGSNPSSNIRNAITGRRYNVKVGSHNEDLFFKVTMALGDDSDPLSLFYDSPEEFERHFFYKVGIEAKTRWLDKREHCNNNQKQR